MNRETGFETFVNKHDVGKGEQAFLYSVLFRNIYVILFINLIMVQVINNRGKRVRLGGPTQERTERQKLQSLERSIFTSLVLNSLSK